MSDLREELARLFAVDDAAKADYERDEWQRARRTKQSDTPTGVDVDAWLASRPKSNPMPQPQQRTAVMDAATSDAWNKWMTDYVRAYVESRLERYTEDATDGIGEAFGDERKYMHGYIDGQIKKLREEVNALRADMNVQTGIARGEISELKSSVPMKRKQRDVA